MARNCDLQGKTALITGGGGLLGPQHAIALATYGAKIILIDLDAAKLEEARFKIKKELPQATVENHLCDITDESEVLKLHSNLIQNSTQIDILVNNAALNPKMSESSDGISGGIENYDVKMLHHEISVGLVGTFLCSKVFGTAMASYGRGSIVNISSDLAIIAPDQRIYSHEEKMESVKSFKPIGYSIVKSGMLGLSRYLATYWAHKGVRSNCLVPGGVFNNQPDHLVSNLEKRIPMQRMAKVTEYREAVAFLASDASSYMTGQQLIIDGGRSCW